VMHPNGAQGSSQLFSGAVQSFDSGRFGYAVRVLPHHRDLPNPYQPGLILWA
jgi:hypothetical protein